VQGAIAREGHRDLPRARLVAGAVRKWTFATEGPPDDPGAICRIEARDGHGDPPFRSNIDNWPS
jgi:hypothetical protein